MSLLRIASVALGLALMIAAVIGIPRLRFGRTTKLALAILGLVFVAVGVVGWYAPARALERVWLIVRGDLVDVGGYRLRIECQGSGAPTVMMDAGLEHDHYGWGTVPGKVAEFTRVCTYDRAGLGESDSGPHPRTSQQIVKEFHALLKNANIPRPYILVGHSFGGANMRLYASQHPDTVVGLVLVDASQEDEIARFAEIMAGDEKAEWLHHEGGGNKEGVDVIASAEEWRTARLAPTLLLTVLSAKPKDVYQDDIEMRLKHELQEKLARLVPTSKHIFVENTSHFIQLDQPESVIQAVHEMVDAVRQQGQGKKSSQSE